MSYAIDDNLKTYKYISDFDITDIDHINQYNDSIDIDTYIYNDTYNYDSISNIYFNIIDYSNQTYLPICEYLTFNDLNNFINDNIL
jgi:hypothetical protein